MQQRIRLPFSTRKIDEHYLSRPEATVGAKISIPLSELKRLQSFDSCCFGIERGEREVTQLFQKRRLNN